MDERFFKDAMEAVGIPVIIIDEDTDFSKLGPFQPQSEFLIERRGDDGRWFILGSERFEHDARRHFHRYVASDGKRFNFRLTESVSRKVIIQSGTIDGDGA